MRHLSYTGVGASTRCGYVGSVWRSDVGEYAYPSLRAVATRAYRRLPDVGMPATQGLLDYGSTTCRHLTNVSACRGVSTSVRLLAVIATQPIANVLTVCGRVYAYTGPANHLVT